MTKDDKDALKEFLRGLAYAVGMVAVIVGIILVFYSDEVPEDTKTHAEVVDTYKGCDVVRWSSHQLAEYRYFLHCENNK